MASVWLPFDKIQRLDIINVPGGLTPKEVKAKYPTADVIATLAMFDMDSQLNFVRLKDEGIKDGYLGSSKGIGIKGDKELAWVSFQEAYADLGYPGADFEETMVRAAVELLRTPVVEGPIRLEMKVLSYAMADETLENLSPAQKHFLRMGPRNMGLVQAKIRELAAAMGVPASRLPKARFYRPRSDKP